jgi:hypothetical protein
MMQEFIGVYAIWEGKFCWGSEMGIGWWVWKCGYGFERSRMGMSEERFW